MAIGLTALLDDIATLARAAAASVDDVAATAARASTKAAGVVIDDAAVIPGQVTGVSPARELPVIWRITKGSLVNKLVIILPIALLLSWIAPWALTPLLMLGGSYLCFEAAHKVLHKIMPSKHTDTVVAPQTEDQLVKGAVVTDFILSAEIMVIVLNELTDKPFWERAIVLFIVGALITLAVYGVVALLIKMDDLGLRLQESESSAAAGTGRALVKGMPVVLNVIGVVGTFAMLWVGGHIMIAGVDEFGWHWPHHLAVTLAEAAGGGFLGWLADTAVALVGGLIWGAIVVLLVEAVSGIFDKSDVKSGEGASAGAPA